MLTEPSIEMKRALLRKVLSANKVYFIQKKYKDATCYCSSRKHLLNIEILRGDRDAYYAESQREQHTKAYLSGSFEVFCVIQVNPFHRRFRFIIKST